MCMIVCACRVRLMASTGSGNFVVPGYTAAVRSAPRATISLTTSQAGLP